MKSMTTTLKNVIRDLAPPLVVRGFRKLRPPKRLPGEEKGPEFYDDLLDSVEHWRRHYTESRYYFIWTVIVDRLLRGRVPRVLEIACGTGQLASLMRDKGISQYRGFDFSPKFVEQAKTVCPEFRFTVEDAFETDLFTTYDYDAVVCTEFLEHVERDVDVLEKIAPGTRVLATVPNFPGGSHVRFFKDAGEVSERYSRYFTGFTVDTFLGTQSGKTYYLLDGTKA